MGANEKADAAMHGVDNTTALIHEGRFLGGSEWKKWWSTGRAQRTLTALADALEAVTVERDSLSRLHEVATERTVQLAAVIESIREASTAEDSDDGFWGAAGPNLAALLASAPGDVLREHDAKVLEDAAEDIHLGDDMETLNRHGNRNVIRNAEAEASSWLEARAAALRVGANPKENER